MADAKKTEAKVEEQQIDEFSAGMFAVMGYAKLTPSIITIFREFKRRKDSLQPGRLSPEGFATVALLADMADGKLVVGKE